MPVHQTCQCGGWQTTRVTGCTSPPSLSTAIRLPAQASLAGREAAYSALLQELHTVRDGLDADARPRPGDGSPGGLACPSQNEVFFKTWV